MMEFGIGMAFGASVINVALYFLGAQANPFTLVAALAGSIVASLGMFKSRNGSSR